MSVRLPIFVVCDATGCEATAAANGVVVVGEERATIEEEKLPAGWCSNKYRRDAHRCPEHVNDVPEKERVF